MRRPLSSSSAGERFTSGFGGSGPKFLLDSWTDAPHPSIPNRYLKPTEEHRQMIFATPYAPPASFGFSRTTWKMANLLDVLRRQGLAINLPLMTQVIRDAGYKWRKAKVVLTSNDRKFRKKVDRVRGILSCLEEDEAFFSIDEFGPFAIRLRAGRALVAPGDAHVVPQWQRYLPLMGRWRLASLATALRPMARAIIHNSNYPPVDAARASATFFL